MVPEERRRIRLCFCPCICRSWRGSETPKPCGTTTVHDLVNTWRSTLVRTSSCVQPSQRITCSKRFACHDLHPKKETITSFTNYAGLTARWYVANRYSFVILYELTLEQLQGCRFLLETITAMYWAWFRLPRWTSLTVSCIVCTERVVNLFVLVLTASQTEALLWQKMTLKRWKVVKTSLLSTIEIDFVSKISACHLVCIACFVLISQNLGPRIQSWGPVAIPLPQSWRLPHCPGHWRHQGLCRDDGSYEPNGVQSGRDPHVVGYCIFILFHHSCWCTLIALILGHSMFATPSATGFVDGWAVLLHQRHDGRSCEDKS